MCGQKRDSSCLPLERSLKWIRSGGKEKSSDGSHFRVMDFPNWQFGLSLFTKQSGCELFNWSIKDVCRHMSSVVCGFIGPPEVKESKSKGKEQISMTYDATYYRHDIELKYGCG